MSEKLVEYDPKAVLSKAKSILQESGCLPSNCPKKTCLGLRGTSIGENETTVYLYANPPLYEATKPGKKHSLNPICENECQIEGNSSRVFVILQNTKKGKVISAKARWESEVY